MIPLFHLVLYYLLFPLLRLSASFPGFFFFNVCGGTHVCTLVCICVHIHVMVKINIMCLPL